MTRDFKRSNLSASSAIMDRLMGPASVVDDDQSEQPSPVFYVDLKEGRRIDFNVLVRAHNAVHQDKIRADSSGDESESEAEAECDLNEDDDDEDDDEDEEEEEQHAAANNGANVTANNGTSNATVPATDVGKNDKKRKKPTARRRKEEEYDKDDGFIDDDDMSDSIDSFGSDRDRGTGSDSEDEAAAVLPANIQALFDKIETDFKTDLEKFRTQAPARFSNIQATKPLLVQVYALIQELPRFGELRKLANAKLLQVFQPLRIETIRIHAQAKDEEKQPGTSDETKAVEEKTKEIRFAPLPPDPWNDVHFLPPLARKKANAQPGAHQGNTSADAIEIEVE